jgi:hypothetical protein
MSTAPRVPRIPARGPVHLNHTPPRWHDVPALRWVTIAAAASLGLLAVHLFRALLEVLA